MWCVSPDSNIIQGFNPTVWKIQREREVDALSLSCLLLASFGRLFFGEHMFIYCLSSCHALVSLLEHLSFCLHMCHPLHLPLSTLHTCTRTLWLYVWNHWRTCDQCSKGVACWHREQAGELPSSQVIESKQSNQSQTPLWTLQPWSQLKDCPAAEEVQ